MRTAKPFYELNKALGNDVDGYLAAVRKHEMLHSELRQESLAQNDPSPKVEALAGNDKAQLLKQIYEIIQGAEDTIDKASQDPLPPVGFNGKIAFPDDATDKYTSIDMGI